MIRLDYLKMEAFRSYVEARISFPERGVVLIDGVDEGTGESSGSGKTNILLAISYALDMCPLSASELQSWHTETPMQVELGLVGPDGPIVIRRGKKNGLKIGTQKEITGAKAISEKLREVFQLDWETLRAITYRPQRQLGFFLNLTDSEKKEFLTKLLGLKAIEEAVDQSDAKLKVLQASKEDFERQRSGAVINLERLQKQLAELPDPEDTEKLRSEIASTEAALAEIDRTLTNVHGNLSNEKSALAADPGLLQKKAIVQACQLQRQTVEAADRARQLEFQNKQELLRKRLQELVRADAQKVTLGQRIVEDTKQLGHARSGKCPVCFRTWEEATKKANELQASIDNWQTQLAQIGDVSAEKSQIEVELRGSFVCDPLLGQLEAVERQLKEDLQRYSFELFSAPERKAKDTVNALSNSKVVLATELKGLKDRLSTVTTTNSKIESIRLSISNSYTQASNELEALQKRAALVSEEYCLEQDFVDLLGYQGFLGTIFDDVLREIEQESNERLGRLANTSRVTVSFRTETETKGTIQKKIVPIASVGGYETKLKAGLSGGMTSSVEAIIDLAVMAVVQRRTGALPGFLILDESFEGQGRVTKEAMHEILKEYGENKLVLVIDHASEFQELFTQTINVVAKNGVSRIDHDAL